MPNKSFKLMTPDAGSREQIDHLLGSMPQEDMAGVDAIKNVGRKTFVPCMDFSERKDDNPLLKLKPRHYEYLLLMAHGATWHEVAVDLGKSMSSVRDYCLATHAALGVHAIEQAAQFIPVPEQELKRVALWKTDESLVARPTLSDAERAAWDDAALGLLGPESAKKNLQSSAVVREHKSAMYQSLGLRNRAVLSRFAGAMRYAPRYEFSAQVAQAVAGPLQPAVAAELERSSSFETHNLEQQVADRLDKNPGLGMIMWGPAAELAQTVVAQEVQCYLGSRPPMRQAA